MAAVHLKNYFRIDCFVPFKLWLLLLSFAAINAKYINFETHTEQSVRTEVKFEGNIYRELAANAKLKTSGNFVEGSQPQN